ncbi:MAG: hypothetical protein AAF846_27450 [Chloroflexota bacterium]
MDKLSAINDYLPKYVFPRFLRRGCGCLALMLIASAALIFLVIPSFFAYIVTLDEYPPLDIQVGETRYLDDFAISLVAIENESTCVDTTPCLTNMSFDLTFSTTFDERTYTVSYIAGEPAPDPIALPLDYLLRVVAVSTDATTAQFYVFKLPVSFTNTYRE